MALRVERAYSPRALRLEDVLGGQLLATAVALPVALLAAVIVRVAVELAGPAWWVLAGLLVAAALAAALRAAPTLLVRLGEVHPLKRTGLAVHLANLARRADVPVASIEEWRIGEPATAAIVTGVGAGRRVLVSADVLRHWSDDEIAVVVAHELAHHAHHDLWHTWALNAAVLAVGLFVADSVIGLAGPSAVTGGPAALASLPLMALVAAIVWMALTPARHALSRHQERRADRFALAWTGNAEAFGAAVRRLGAAHLSEERPSPIARWLFFSHPPMTERLAFAEAYQRRLGTEPARAPRSSAER
jgi:STE24 endopeptidase